MNVREDTNNVRRATIDDLETISRMALEFAGKGVHALFSNEATIVALLKQFLQEMSNGIVFVDEDGHGFIAGCIFQFPYGTCLQAVELAWWVDEEYRKSGLGSKLLEEFECWAASKGCELVTMMALDDHVGTFYEKNGYTLAERTYMKDLKPWQR